MSTQATIIYKKENGNSEKVFVGYDCYPSEIAPKLLEYSKKDLLELVKYNELEQLPNVESLQNIEDLSSEVVDAESEYEYIYNEATKSWVVNRKVYEYDTEQKDYRLVTSRYSGLQGSVFAEYKRSEKYLKEETEAVWNNIRMGFTSELDYYNERKKDLVELEKRMKEFENNQQVT